MTKQNQNAADEFRRLRIEAGILQPQDCSKEENEAFLELVKAKEALPEGVFQYQYSDNGEAAPLFYRVKDRLSEAEKQEYLQLKQFKMIKTIKTCVVFFTALTAGCLVLSMILGIIFGGLA